MMQVIRLLLTRRPLRDAYFQLTEITYYYFFIKEDSYVQSYKMYYCIYILYSCPCFVQGALGVCDHHTGVFIAEGFDLEAEKGRLFRVQVADLQQYP